MQIRLKKIFNLPTLKKPTWGMLLQLKTLVKRDFSTLILYFISFLFLSFSLAYLFFYYPYLSLEVPLWNSLPWGVYRISVKHYIYIIPSINLLIILLGYYISRSYLKYNIKEAANFVGWVILISTTALSYSIIDIVNRSKIVTFTFGSWFDNFLLPFVVALLISQVVSKVIIRYAHRLHIIEYPNLRKEPQKVLETPTPRGGAIAFWAGFVITSLLFLGFEQRVVGLVLGITVTTISGYLDDRFKLHFLPRLVFLLPLAIIPIILSGFVMMYIPNPFGEIIKLDQLRFTFELYGSRSILVYGFVAAFLWFIWLSNMVSWNNGIDGQFVAITSIAVLVIGILSLRFDVLTYENLLSSRLSFIALGALLGLFYDTFPPQKVIWGFGATGVGLLLGALSLLSGTRVSTAVMVLIIPSIDTLWVILNRLKNKRSPFVGDRNHLHHKLLDLGWSKRRIAVFYWLVTIAFGAITLVSSERYQTLTFLTISGLVLYGIVIIRKSSQAYLEKRKQ